MLWLLQKITQFPTGAIHEIPIGLIKCEYPSELVTKVIDLFPTAHIETMGEVDHGERPLFWVPNEITYTGKDVYELKQIAILNERD